MTSTVQFITIFLICLGQFLEIRGRTLVSVEDHLQKRQELLQEEYDMMFGEKLKLSPAEQIVNKILMKAKHREIDDGFEDLSQFNAAHHFFSRKPYIEKSEVFKIIKQMPKGAALHGHDTALIGGEYLINITYRSNLYACFSNDDLQLQFSANTPKDNNCEWQLLQDVREKHESVEEFDKSLAERFTLNTEDHIEDNNNNYEIWEKFSKVFGLITPMLTYKPVWEDYFYEALKQYRADNILYVEIRTTLPLLYDLEGNIYDEVECAKSFKIAHDRFIKDFPDSYGMRIIYAPLRNVDNAVVQKYIEITKEIKKILGDFVAGFDLVGQEDLGRPLIDFIEELVDIPEDIDLFFHSAETNWYGTTTDYNIVDAVLLGAKRLGHAYGLIKHPAVSKIVKEKEIALEVNPISNQVLGYVEDLRNHPANQLFAENYSVIISSDDPGLWGALPLSHDMYAAFTGISSRRSDIRFLKQLALNSIKHSSMPSKEKLDAFTDFFEQWNTFIEKVAQSYNGTCSVERCEFGNDNNV